MYISHATYRCWPCSFVLPILIWKKKWFSILYRVLLHSATRLKGGRLLRDFGAIFGPFLQRLWLRQASFIVVRRNCTFLSSFNQGSHIVLCTSWPLSPDGRCFSTWLLFMKEKPKNLSASLFLLGPEDMVQCAWCYGKLQGWEQGDDPLIEHARHFASCPKFGNRKAVNATSLIKVHHTQGRPNWNN